jgi:hypothetical protein
VCDPSEPFDRHKRITLAVPGQRGRNARREHAAGTRSGTRPKREAGRGGNARPGRAWAGPRRVLASPRRWRATPQWRTGPRAPEAHRGAAGCRAGARSPVCSGARSCWRSGWMSAGAAAVHGVGGAPPSPLPWTSTPRSSASPSWRIPSRWTASTGSSAGRPTSPFSPSSTRIARRPPSVVPVEADPLCRTTGLPRSVLGIADDLGRHPRSPRRLSPGPARTVRTLHRHHDPRLGGAPENGQVRDLPEGGLQAAPVQLPVPKNELARTGLLRLRGGRLPARAGHRGPLDRVNPHGQAFLR